MSRLVVLAALVALAPQAAEACQQRADFDPWFATRFNSLPAIYERATTIDRVKINAAPPLCPPSTAASTSCALNAEAVVIERLKGDSVPRYSLARAPSDRRADNYGIDEISPRLADGRLAFAPASSATPRSVAAAGHRSEAFWDMPEIAPNSAQQGCVKLWELEPTLSYIIFRRADGLAIAAEPIADENDMLLQRLRMARSGAPLMPSRSVQAFLGGASTVALVEHSTCSLRKPKRTRIVRLAGDGGSAVYYAPFWRPEKPGECAVIKSLLVFGEDVLPAMAAVDHGMVERSDLLTGFRLTGPSAVRVEDAFRWFKAGQPSKADRRLSWRPADGLFAFFAFVIDAVVNLSEPRPSEFKASTFGVTRPA